MHPIQKNLDTKGIKEKQAFLAQIRALMSG